ncbi:unnamed protein product, partial [Meganyctiphanes norvegica]
YKEALRHCIPYSAKSDAPQFACAAPPTTPSNASTTSAMGDEVEKKKKSKKSKSKKTEGEEAPAPEPEAAPAPEPEPEPEPAPAPPAEEEGFDFAACDAAPAESEYPVDGDEGLPPPPAKQKPKFYLHWDRKKSKFYDYNFDYGENYYSSMVRHLETRGDIPLRRTFADRAIRSSVNRKAYADVRTENLLASVNSCIRNFETSQRAYVRA